MPMWFFLIISSSMVKCSTLSSTFWMNQSVSLISKSDHCDTWSDSESVTIGSFFFFSVIFWLNDEVSLLIKKKSIEVQVMSSFSREDDSLQGTGGAGITSELSESRTSDFVSPDISLICPTPNYSSSGFATEIPGWLSVNLFLGR